MTNKNADETNGVGLEFSGGPYSDFIFEAGIDTEYGSTIDNSGQF